MNIIAGICYSGLKLGSYLVEITCGKKVFVVARHKRVHFYSVIQRGFYPGPVLWQEESQNDDI